MSISATDLGTHQASVTNSLAVTVSATAEAGRIVLLITSETNIDGTPATVTGVTGLSATWTQRAVISRTGAGNIGQHSEEWYADVPLGASGTITATLSRNFDDGNMHVTLVSSLSGGPVHFDANASFPATLDGVGEMAVTSDSSTPYLLLMGAIGDNSTMPASPTPVSTNVSQVLNGGAVNWQYSTVDGGSPGPLSGTNAGYGSIDSNFTGIIDAFTDVGSISDTALTTDAVHSSRVSGSASDTALTTDFVIGARHPINETAFTSDSARVSAFHDAVAETALTTDSLSGSPTIIRGPIYATARVRSKALGFGRVMPPEPEPGPSGQHDYQVLVVDKYGVAIGPIPSAVPMQIDKVLNGIGQTLIDAYILDPCWGTSTTPRVAGGPNTDALLPISLIPGGREIQIWRDGQLIDWCVVTSVTFDAKQVHITCQSLLWYFQQLDFGPITTNYAGNPGFEEPYDNSDPSNIPGWILASGGGSVADLSVVTADGVDQVLVGNQACKLVSFVSDDSIYAYQDVAFAGGSIGLAVEMSAWFYILGSFTPNPSNTGIKIIGADVPGSQSITPNTAPNQWNRIVCDAFVNPGASDVLQFQLFSVAGTIYWDEVNISIQESVGSPPTGADAATIIQQIIEYANDPTRGKSDKAIPFVGPATGKTLVRDYQFYDNAGILDALNEYPTIGICDFDITWDATGHFRQFEIFPPAKGSYKYNYPVEIDLGTVTDLQGTVDGTQSATSVRWLGQGSTGSSEDMGYSAFPSLLGGRIGTVESVTMGSIDLTASGLNFTSDDVGQPIYALPNVLQIGTVIDAVISSTEVTLSKPAINTAGPLTLIGVGGLILDSVQSALPDQLPGTLQGSSDNYLQRFMEAQFLPAARFRADGPRGLFGKIDVGDVVPVMFNYGFLQYGPRMARVAQVSFYPQTEEIQPQLSPVPILEAIY